MINNTNNKIRYSSYKFFLEKGYEATNIRDICRSVNIKPSSLYFYYKSKQDLFFSIYDEIWNEKIKYMNNVVKSSINLTSDLKFKNLYLKMLEYHIENILNEKFLLRYHFFPAEEIATTIIDKYKCCTKEENKIITDLIEECIELGILNNKINTIEYVQEYKKFMTNQIINMLIYNVKISLADHNIIWDKFWNHYLSGEYKAIF